MTEIAVIKEKDLSRVAGAYCNAFNDSGFDEEWSQEKALSFMRYFYKAQPKLFLVARVQREIVGGIASFIKPWWNGNRLADIEIFVIPQYQRQGVGKALLKAQIKKGIKDYDIVEIEEITRGKDEFPLTWYKRIGFGASGLINIEANAEEVLKNLDK